MTAARDPARNVWLALGLPGAEEHYLKAELVLRLARRVRALALTQRAAAKRIGTTQPELAKILGGKFSEVSLERLMRFLTALGLDIDITVGEARARRPRGRAGALMVRDAAARPTPAEPSRPRPSRRARAAPSSG